MKELKSWKGEEARELERQRKCPECLGRLQSTGKNEINEDGWCSTYTCYHCDRNFYKNYNDMGQGIDQLDLVDNFKCTLEITSIEDIDEDKMYTFMYKNREYKIRLTPELEEGIEDKEKHFKLKVRQHLNEGSQEM